MASDRINSAGGALSANSTSSKTPLQARGNQNSRPLASCSLGSDRPGRARAPIGNWGRRGREGPGPPAGTAGLACSRCEALRAAVLTRPC